MTNIVIIGQDQGYISTLKVLLERRDFAVAVHHDAKNALAAITTNAPQLIIIENELTSIKATDLANTVLQAFPDRVKIIVLTSKLSKSQAQTWKELGITAYAKVNLDFLEFLKGIRQLVESVP